MVPTLVRFSDHVLIIGDRNPLDVEDLILIDECRQARKVYTLWHILSPRWKALLADDWEAGPLTTTVSRAVIAWRDEYGPLGYDPILALGQEELARLELALSAGEVLLKEVQGWGYSHLLVWQDRTILAELLYRKEV
ncbi:hypothetical protein [Thermogutta sp.]|uniref:hypothetical protein n=1 Tax=Thermogutta sp. TaxID=1962930 RepID=UPI00321FE197